MLEVTETATGILPLFQLPIKEPGDAAVFHDVCLALQHLLACLQFHGTQAVFVEIVGVHPVYAEGCVTVASPAAAEIQLVIDSADAVTAGECQSEGIILAIACIGKLYLAHQRGEEGAGRPESVDAQGIVATVVLGPFLMVDESRGQGVEVEVAHTVRADDHRRLLLVEGVHYLLKRLGRGIEVVAV